MTKAWWKVGELAAWWNNNKSKKLRKPVRNFQQTSTPWEHQFPTSRSFWGHFRPFGEISVEACENLRGKIIYP